MTLHGKNFVGDQLPMGSGDAFHATNPLDSAALEPAFRAASANEVNAAMEQAHLAFTSYRETTGAQRAEFLERVGEELLALGDDLIQRAHQETGLPEARLKGERERTVNQLRLFAQV